MTVKKTTGIDADPLVAQLGASSRRTSGRYIVGVSSSDRPALILGAGINGAALARELALNGVPVCVVDCADLAAGATAYSSRLIHGGLRYLEYGEFDLVRESLAERNRLLSLAPDYVTPLRLYVPVTNRFGGVGTSIRRFLRWERNSPATPPARGMWLVKLGLWFYDAYAGTASIDRHRVHRTRDNDVPRVDRAKYRWLCAYSDAQIRYPERLVVALLRDAAVAARQSGVPFEVYTYHEARRDGDRVALTPLDPLTGQSAGNGLSVDPAAIVNATGAWVDRTLERLEVPSDRLMGGTKGSHIVSSHQGLREALRGRGIYAEADDGRPVFLLPWGNQTLVGTTDVRFAGDPADAVANDEEIDYLLATVRDIVPEAPLRRDDIDLHYSGVRPLPYQPNGTPGSITRRHQIISHAESPVPFLSLVGGKLTTCRSLAEEVTAQLLKRFHREVERTSAERPIPALPIAIGDDPAATGTLWDAARVAIREEWARSIGDLVERRLMLLYDPGLRQETLEQLAQALVEEGHLAPDRTTEAVAHAAQRLNQHFGKKLAVGAKA